MTTATHPLTGQSAGPGVLGQQGTFGPGFPPPIGAEQFFGLVPQVQNSYSMPGVGSYPVPAYGTPWQSATMPFALSSPGHVAAQIVPMAQQAILPYAISAACQQVQQLLPQIVAQLAGPWPQYPTSMPGVGIFGQFSRPPYLP